MPTGWTLNHTWVADRVERFAHRRLASPPQILRGHRHEWFRRWFPAMSSEAPARLSEAIVQRGAMS